MYYMRLCSEKLLSDIRARTLFVLLPRSRCLSSPRRHLPALSRASSLFLFKELSTGVTLHLAPVSRVVGSYSRRFERTPKAISVSPFSPFRRLYLVRTSLFIHSIPLQQRKRIAETTTTRVDRPSSSASRSEKSASARRFLILSIPSRFSLSSF